MQKEKKKQNQFRLNLVIRQCKCIYWHCDLNNHRVLADLVQKEGLYQHETKKRLIQIRSNLNFCTKRFPLKSPASQWLSKNITKRLTGNYFSD